MDRMDGKNGPRFEVKWGGLSRRRRRHYWPTRLEIHQQIAKEVLLDHSCAFVSEGVVRVLHNSMYVRACQQANRSSGRPIASAYCCR